MSSYSTKAKKVDGKLEKLAKKRVPVNPKYAHVKSTLNTGASLTKYLEKLEEIRSNYRFQKNEIFKRMKVTTFAQLVVQVERYKQARDPLFGDILEEEEGSTTPTDLNSNENTTNSRSNGKTENSSDYKLKPPPTNDNRVLSPTLTESDFGDQPGTQRSTLHGLIFGVGEKDAEKHETDSVYQSNRSSISSRNSSTAGYGQNTDSEAAPYLLLDCQDEEDFEKCHIVGAINFPKSRLSRAVNYEISPMFDYKNKPGKVIVVYDADEQVAIQVVTSLVERGYDNLFMLSGGLKVTYQKVPALITGCLPKAALVPNPTDSARPGAGSKKSSVASEIQLDPEIRVELSGDDVDLIEEQLGNSLEGCESDIEAASVSSRSLSGRTTVPPSSRSSIASSRTSQASERTTGAGDGQKTRWK